MFGALALGGYTAGVVHLLAHGAFKALLFLAAGSIIHAVGTQRVDSMGGLRGAMPVTFASMTVGLAALAGIPPFVGFFSKDAVLGLAADQALHGHQPARSWLLLVAGLITAAVTAAYCTRTWLLVFWGPHRGSEPRAAPHESPPLMTIPLMAFSWLCVVGGAAVVFPHFLGVDREPLHWATMAVSLAVVLASVGFTATEWRRLEMTDPAVSLGRWRGVLAAEFSYDRILAAVVNRPTDGAVRVVQAAEIGVVEPYVRGAEAGARWSGRLVRLAHDGNAQRYLTAVAIGAVALAVIVGVAS
jgi:NADH-quinone oxidoreductase subunit L